MTIHPTAIVSSNAKIGEGTIVGPYCVIGPSVVLGRNNHLIGNVHIQGDTAIQDDNTFYPFTAIGYEPQDPKFKGELTKLTIGSSNIFRESVTLNVGTHQGGGVTEVGHKNMFMAYSHVGHDCHVGDENTFVNHVSLAGHVTVGHFCTLSGYVGVTQRVRIGSYSMIGAGCIVSLDIPPYVLGKAKINQRVGIQAINRVGLKRRGVSDDDISLIDQAFRMIYKRNLTLQEAINQLPSKENPYIQNLYKFLEESERGIAR